MLLYWLLTETDCSGRALATLVIAWVGAALVASVLLKWTHMWVALAVLTLLFLVACGYAAYDARRTQERAFARETSRQQDRRRRREQQLESVSEGIDNFPEITDPPEYQTYWVADLPPSYTTAVGTQPENVSATTTPDAEEIPPAIRAPRLSNPPPYALAVQTEPLFIPIMQNGIQNVDTTLQLQGVPVAGQNVILQTSIENGQTSSHNGRIPPAIPPAIRDRDKVEEGDENGQNTLTCAAPPPTRTQYLTSILSSTFGRNMRRANNNQEQNSNAVGFQTNRDETVVNCSNNNDRNNNNNNNNNIGAGPPPPYPVTRLSTD